MWPLHQHSPSIQPSLGSQDLHSSLGYSGMLKGVRFAFPYLDDILVIGKPNSLECAAAVGKLLELLDFPVKREGPATTLEFLGFEVDSRAVEIQLQARKLEELNALLLLWRWQGKSSASQTGHLRPGPDYLAAAFCRYSSGVPEELWGGVANYFGRTGNGLCPSGRDTELYDPMRVRSRPAISL